ncbi:aryl-sulfate sulfotransferase [Parabacteroides timonensis]|uniref:aryl-sulfate sulfotransferase n=1 Tax=Parabacteroides timonensis TaxID=1871013 RepID=UPI00094ED3B5|nr:aryl-sulfate sulfotransferase [Parabacteroides timonensis]
MNEIRHYLSFGMAILCGGLICSCEKEEQSYNEVYTSIDACIKQNNILLNVEQETDNTYFFFDGDTVSIPTNTIASINTEATAWKTTLTGTDGTTIIIPTLGNSLNLSKESIKVNPTGYAPCSMQLTVPFPVEGRLKVCVKGKHGSQGDLSYLFSKFGYNHQEYIHGLYRDSNNTVDVSFANKEGKVLLTETIEVETTPPEDLVPDFFSSRQTVVSKPEQMEPGVTIVNDQGGGEYDAHRAYMLDSDGEVRWYLWLRNHPKLNITAHCGFKRLANGNFLGGDARKGNLFEFDMVGNLVKEWDIATKGYTFHHDVIEMPNGNLLATVTKAGSLNSEGTYTRFDYVIEVNRETGNIVTEWDLKKSLNPARDALMSKQDIEDFKHNWAHSNAVAYSQEDDCILVSNRYQGLVKLTRDNRLVWFLTPHRGAEKNRSALLMPLDANRNPITDKDVIDGKTAHEDFEWIWGAHCPVLLDNGHVLIFDNGYHRHHEEIDLYSQVGYSRAVEYVINEKQKTIQQVWEYGHKEQGRRCYSVALSSVQYLPQTKHVLFGPGVGTPNVNGAGGKIIEVDYDTKEVVYEVHISRPDYLVFHRVERISLYPENL